MTKRNIFLAMGFEPEDAMILALRSDLADAIARFLSESGISQKDAVKLLKFPQATVSHILNGKIDHVSVERLMRAMVRAKLPGYARWPSIEAAKAGLLPATEAATVTNEVEMDFEYDPYPLEDDFKRALLEDAHCG